MTPYEEFIHRRTQLGGNHGFEPRWMPDFLFPFQSELVTWAIRKGRSALFEDCGLGKTPQQLVWAHNVALYTGRPVLIIAPLAVTHQTVREAEKFGIAAAVSRDGSITEQITVTNYDRLHHFDRDDFAGVVCDESSAIKSFDGQRRALVTDFARKLPYRLLCTATAAPNDYVELGTSSEALGELGHMDMLSRFFVNDQNSSHSNRQWDGSKFRLKGHAVEPFWRWVASWARALRRPSDYGFSDDGFDLPELIYRQTEVVARESAPGQLFDTPAIGLREEREELRRTLTERCETAAAILSEGSDPGIAWCHLNDEGDLLTKLIPGAVQVKGSDDPDAKEEALSAFSRGEIRVLVSKASICGFGLNWAHCNRMTFFPSHSYEQSYQAVRRCWRFGQTRPVTVDIVTTEGGSRALINLERKAAAADQMFDALVAHMRDALTIDRAVAYDKQMELPAWMK